MIGKLVIHRDIPNERWNVFHQVDGMEYFVIAFDTLPEAQDYCAINNDVLVLNK